MRHGMRLGILAAGALVLISSAVQAASEDPIQLAIDRGVDYLKKSQSLNGTTPPDIGANALVGLALLECRVPAEDPVVQKAAQSVREASVGLTYTYSLALSILFLDRLGDPEDVPLIQSMTVRLLAGQKGDHGWTYECPPISDAELHRLSSLVHQRTQLTTRNVAPQISLPGKRLASPLPREIKDQLKLLSRTPPVPMITDNSNTQFATLALWVARRYDMPVDRALERVEQRFRSSQNADGGWGYFPLGRGMNLSTPTMTCAGLLGLAVAHGVTNARLHGSTTLERNPPVRNNSFRDPAVRAGLVAAGSTIGYPVGNKKGPQHPVPIIGRGGRGYYYLWSLERVAVIYGLHTINKKDWYAWGAEILLASQRTDGSWQGQYPQGGVDTCFALLFLRRANLAQDLTVSLRGQVHDPGDLNLPGAAPVREVPIAKVLGPGLNPDGKPEGGPSQATPPVSRRNEEGSAASALVRPAPPVKTNAPPAGVSSLAGSSPAKSGEACNTEPNAGQLVAELIQAPAARKNELIERFKGGKGCAYTDALAAAIHHLEGVARSKARDALAERLTRMTTSTLRGKLADEDLEVRSAAALACGMRDEKTSIPDLIPLLEDPEPRVSQAAHLALKSLTGKDFGPGLGAAKAQQALAAAAWKAWWNSQNPK